MRVINTDSWAGETFSYRPGEVIELPDEIAEARIEAGLARPVGEMEPLFEDEPEAEQPKKKGRSKAK
jgi:hypothetical protein